MLPPLRPIFPQFAGRRQAALNFLIAHSGGLICALFLLVGLALAGDYGLGIDAGEQRQIAVGNRDYILGRADRIATRDYHDRVYGAAFELPLLLAERVSGLTESDQVSRLRLTLIHLFFIVGGYFCYRLAYHWFGSRPLALLALLFYLLHPRIYAHSFLNSKDLPFLSMFMIALYLLERAGRRDTVGAFVLLGIAVGLLTNLRIMGITLLAAALAMRGLDWFYAGNGPERKRILRTGGLFLLAAGLTWYAATPYAWLNPGDYWATSLNLTVNHPTVVSQLFRGARIFSDQLPPHYAVTWFGITMPPLLLVLGGIGMAAAAVRFCRRPEAVFHSARWRFALLLLACFLLPPLAAALLGSNHYQGWRHFYFLYAPFCLLAALGGGWLLTALSRRRRWRVGVGGLAALGLGLIALQMAQLHPLQYNYFNFLVARASPEGLRTQYDLDIEQLAVKAALESLGERHSGETLTVRAPRRHWQLLAADARRRLRPAAAGGRADYELIIQPAPSQPDLAFNWAYRRRIYNNTLVDLRPLDAARMSDRAVAAYQEIYRDAAAGEPVIRADYNVYRQGQRFIFVKENCRPEEPAARFEARFFPYRPETLPPYLWRVESYAPFGNSGVRLGDICLAVIQLPAYARGDLILARYDAGSYRPQDLPLWSELYSLSRPGFGELVAEGRRRPGQPAKPAAFEVFSDRDAGRNRLLYAKGDCAQAEYETRVTLHIYPVNLADLPARHQANGFDNRDFLPDFYGGRAGGGCIAIVPLPDYPIAYIRTGQGDSWEVNLYPPADPDYLRAAYAALVGLEPAARSDFDLYVRDKRLTYLREICAAGDTAAGFFLHIIPGDVGDLPAERQEAGFANLDFAFARWGGHFDGKCLAAVALPDYPIAAVRTGQYVAGQGERWAVELAVGR